VPRFTAETAVEMGRRSAEARRLLHLVPIEPPPPPPTPAPTEEPTDGYRSARLVRVRAQLDRIDDMMIEEDDPAKLDRLASAQARLSEQERILRGEPLPGSRRPAPERAKGRRSGGESGGFHAAPTHNC
jgi:hypothetical protein